jgi:2-iminoacetate synthase ThiH
MLSTMNHTTVDESSSARIARLGKRVIAGGEISRAEARWLFELEDSADVFDLLSWANRIRVHFKGNKIHLCSIVNIKAGGCSENCRFCSQSALYQTDSPRYGLIEPEPMRIAADEAQAKGVTALGLVAARSSTKSATNSRSLRTAAKRAPTLPWGSSKAKKWPIVSRLPAASVITITWRARAVSFLKSAQLTLMKSACRQFTT